VVYRHDSGEGRTPVITMRHLRELQLAILRAGDALRKAKASSEQQPETRRFIRQALLELQTARKALDTMVQERNEQEKREKG
jgi:hypothetical protein